MVLESRPEDEEAPAETSEPLNRRHPCFDRKVWDDSTDAEYATQEMQEEKEKWIDDDEWLEAEEEGATRVPSSACLIIVDNGDVCMETEPAHRSRQDSSLPREDQLPGVQGPSR